MPGKVHAYIGVGSNIRPEQNIRRALRLLTCRVHIIKISTFYRTPAIGAPDGEPFVNGVVDVETTASPGELKWCVLRSIEHELGRKRSTNRYAPRPIDLDLLVFNGVAATTGDLVLPDPEIRDRAFLALPLYELAPDLVLPGSGETVRQLALALARQPMEALPEYTAQLREEIANGRGENRDPDTGAAGGDRRGSRP